MRNFGIERERFIVDARGKIVPSIGVLLPRVHEVASREKKSTSLFTFELFAGQIEDRTPPCPTLNGIEKSLLENEAILSEAANGLGLGFDHSEFVPEERILAFEVNPFDERHQSIWASITPERRIAASAVAAIHVHISTSDEEAVRILNRCRGPVIDHLSRIGDHSNSKRINAYRSMAETDGVPPTFTNMQEVRNYIESKGGEKNVWDLVRYKPSTRTVEFRMFGSTEDVAEITGYIRACCEVSEI